MAEQFFGGGLQFAFVGEYTCKICIECSHFGCVADLSVVKICVQCFESIYPTSCSAVNVFFRV